MRLVRPQAIDLRLIADGVIRNNMGVGGIELRVRGALADGSATLAETGQRLPVTGGPARSPGPWLWLDVTAFALGRAAAVGWRREAPGPAAAPGSAEHAPRAQAGHQQHAADQ